MGIIQKRSRRKPTGGRYRPFRKKRILESGDLPSFTKLGKTSVRAKRTVGGNVKRVLLSHEVANLYDPSTKKYMQVKIKTILESPSNRNFVRRNIMTKGTILETDKGKARITNRPGQEGTINAVLVKEK